MSGDSLPVNVEGGDVITLTACSQEIARIISYGEHCFAVLYLKSLSTEPISSVLSNWLFSFPVYSMEICCNVQFLFGIFSEFCDEDLKQITFELKKSVEGIVHPNMNICSWFTHTHDIPLKMLDRMLGLLFPILQNKALHKYHKSKCSEVIRYMWGFDKSVKWLH